MSDKLPALPERVGSYPTHVLTPDELRAVQLAAWNAAIEAALAEAENDDHEVSGRGYYDQLGDARATQKNIAAAIREMKEKQS